VRRQTAFVTTLTGIALAAALVPAMAASADDPPAAVDAATLAPSVSPSPTGSASAPAPEPAPGAPSDATDAPTDTAADAAASTAADPTPPGSDATDPSTNTDPLVVDDLAAVRWGSSVLIAVLDNDSDTEGDPLQVVAVTPGTLGQGLVEGDVVRYTPDGTQVGVDTLTYTVVDGQGGEATATITVAVGRQQAVRLRARPVAHALATQTLGGVVTPTDEGSPRLRLFRRTDGEWTRAASPTVRRDGSFTSRWTARAPGIVRWRAEAVWPDGGVATSDVERVHVVVRLDPTVRSVTRRAVPYTWRPGCPVGPDRLRAIDLNYWDYQGRLRRGTLIGSSWVVADYIHVFRAALRGHFEIKKLVPADAYRGVDERAMAAGATSAFNCRHVTGNPYRMSQHSWGDAIDINPFENPYVTNSRVYPAAAARRYYHHRSEHLRDPGVITGGSVIASALFGRGWLWGARWSNPDYQHWSRNGG
jgi:hypothetical protein